MNGYETLAKILVDDLKVAPELVGPEATLEDVEFDSLTLVELALLLERNLGVDLQDHELAEAGTLAEMGRMVAERAARVDA